MDGLLLVDKPAGWTSHDAVAFVRRTLGIKRAGHTGTLDPDATGLLLVMTGKATRLARYFADDDKTYEVVMRLGFETDTQDASGELTKDCDVPDISGADVRAAFDAFTGDIMQTPPMYSAVKKDGRPLYKRARAGEVIEREPRRVTVREITPGPMEPPRVAFSVRCSKGLYVRTLCEDIGRELGSCAHMETLRRTSAGDYSVEDALDISPKPGRAELEKRLIPMGEMLGSIPAAVAYEDAARGLSFGKTPGHEGYAALPEGLEAGTPVRVLDAAGTLLAMAEVSGGEAGETAAGPEVAGKGARPLRLTMVFV